MVYCPWNFQITLTDYQVISLYLSLVLLAIAYIFMTDSGDDDDQDGGMMQPVYLGSQG